MAEALIDLTGKVFVITGGNSGIGLGIARGVARAGGSVAIWARRVKESAVAVAELEALGARAVAYPCDVTDESRVDACLAETLRDFGRLDGLVANSGTSGRHAFVDMPTEDWRHVLAVNLDGAFYCLRAAARQLVAQGEGGALVGMSSVSSIHGAPGQQHYAASKAAMEAVMRSLAVELARHRIRCNSLLPGWTHTPLTEPGRQNEKFVANTTSRTPVRRWAAPEDFEVIGAFLCDPTITFHTGASLVVDGGYTVF